MSLYVSYVFRNIYGINSLNWWPGQSFCKFYVHCQISLPRDCTVLHSHWPRYADMWVPVTLKPYQQNVLSNFWIFANVVDEKWYLLWLRLICVFFFFFSFVRFLSLSLPIFLLDFWYLSFRFLGTFYILGRWTLDCDMYFKYILNIYSFLFIFQLHFFFLPFRGFSFKWSMHLNL